MRNPIGEAIKAAGLTIYDPIAPGDPSLWYPDDLLELVLWNGLKDQNYDGVKLRTRSKLAKVEVAKILGYPVPSSFKRCRPRFSGQDLDVYVQASDNLQIWNEELSAARRYVLVRLHSSGDVSRVKVVNGAELVKLDTTGKITKKYQAAIGSLAGSHELISPTDSAQISSLIGPPSASLKSCDPTSEPTAGGILPIQEVFLRCSAIVGSGIPYEGATQERLRGAGLHSSVCKALGYSSAGDNGQFPDVRHQLLEIKLQTSPTIDLGLVLPSSTDPLGLAQINNIQVRHCDIRYLICYGTSDGDKVTITNLILTTGADFFSRFTQFKGKVSNGKIQLPLPSGFWD